MFGWVIGVYCYINKYMKPRLLILGLLLFSAPTFADTLKDRGIVRWDADSRNCLKCSEMNLFLRILCEPIEFVANIGMRWPVNIIEEGALSAKDWGLTAGERIPVIGHIAGGVAGLGVGAFKGMAEGFIYSFPAVIEPPAVVY